MEINFTRNFLKAEEISDIVNNMLQYDSYITRDICKILMVANFVTDYKVDKTEDGELILSLEQYDELSEIEFNDLLYDNISNSYLIDNAIKYEESVENTLIKLVDSINNKLDGLGDEIKQINLSDIVDKLKEK